MRGQAAHVEALAVHVPDLRRARAVRRERDLLPRRAPARRRVGGLGRGEPARARCRRRPRPRCPCCPRGCWRTRGVLPSGLNAGANAWLSPFSPRQVGDALALEDLGEVDERRALAVGDVGDRLAVRPPGRQDVERAVHGHAARVEAVVVDDVELLRPPLLVASRSDDEGDPRARDALVLRQRHDVVGGLVREDARVVGLARVAPLRASPGRCRRRRRAPRRSSSPFATSAASRDQDLRADALPVLEVRRVGVQRRDRRRAGCPGTNWNRSSKRRSVRSTWVSVRQAAWLASSWRRARSPAAAKRPAAPAMTIVSCGAAPAAPAAGPLGAGAAPRRAWQPPQRRGQERRVRGDAKTSA